MKINNASIDIDTQYPTTQSYSRREINLNDNNLRNSIDTKHNMGLLGDPFQDELEISIAAKATLQQEQVQKEQILNDRPIDSETSKSGLSDDDHLKIEILRHLLRMISGKDDAQNVLQPESDSNITVDKLKSLINQAQLAIKISQSPLKAGPGFEMKAMEKHQENGQMEIKATGTIQTPEGQRFDFNVQLKLDQQFFIQNDNNFPVRNVPRLNLQL